MRITLSLVILPVLVACPRLSGAQSPEPPRPALGEVEAAVARKIDAARGEVLSRPSSPGAWGLYGMVLDAHRLPGAAIPAYREAARLDPSDFRWPYFLATLLERIDPRAAVDWYLRALELDRGYAPAEVRLGETLEVLGRDHEAASHFERAARLDPANPLAPFGLGRIALAADRIEEAVSHLERAYTLAPRVQAIVATLARAYRLAGRAELASQRASQARLLPPKTHHPDPRRAAVQAEAVDVETRLGRVQTLKQVGQLEPASREIESLLEQRPELASAHFLAADVYDRLGRPAAALAAVDRALELDPQLAGAGAVRAGTLFKLQRFAEAERQAHRVLASDPDNLHMLILVSMTEGRRGSLEGMAAALDRAFAVRTRDSPLRHLLATLLSELAEVHAEAGDFERAAERGEQALQAAIEAGAPPEVLEQQRRRRDAYRGREVSRPPPSLPP